MFKTIDKLIVAALGLAVVLVVTAPAAYADDWDKATKITVNQPFEIPGMILPAGTYVMKIADLQSDRHVVRFFSEDESTLYATLLAFPNFRLQPTDDTAFSFYEAEAGRARALHEWFYPGSRLGVEFAYPEGRAAEIAAATEEYVVAYKAPEPEPVFREKPAPEVAELIEEPLVEYVPPTAEEIEATPEPTFAAAVEPAVEALPKTATSLPFVLLIGFLAAGTASGIRFFRG